MAIQTIEYLKSKFETGDIPIEDDFVDLIDTLSTPSDTKLGFLNKSNWVDSEQISITLDTPMDSIVEANVSVYEEIPQTGLTNSIWDIITGELGFTLADSAYAVILTPSATTGDSINFTLGSGSWSSSDIGKIIKNVSESETGEARIISIVDDIATCKITIDFTDTNAIAGGDWELYSGEFIDGGFALSSATQVGIPGTPQVFESSTTYYISVAMLTSTKAIVCYRDAVNSNFGTACILDVSGTTITHGTPQVFESSTTQEVSVAMLTSTKAIVCYRDVGNTSFGTACILNTEIPLYISSQHVPAISNNNDSVDTTYYIDLNSVTATETLNSQIVNYTFSFNPTFTDSDLTGGTFIIIGSGQSTVRNIVSSLNTVHGGTEGNWYINTNITYSSETWIAATTNSAHGALSQAEAIAVNNMSGTDVGNVIDVNWPEFGTKFACAIILYSNDINKTPNIDKIEFNYDANVLNQLETDQYTIDIPSTNIINVTAPLTGGSRNARVYISK